MSSPEAPTQITPAELPEGLASVGDYATYSAAFEHSVVLVATGNACWIVSEGERHRLLVEPAAESHAREQLARYDRESVGWPPPPITDRAALPSPDVLTPLVWSLAVLAIYRMQAGHPSWVRDGTLDPGAIFGRGEWWRIGTALFLHGNAEHVISNALSGVLVFTAVISTIGRLRGWLLVATASLLGNLAIAALNIARDYRSLGASTAIFAALGLLTGRAVRVVIAHGKHPHRWRALFVPAAAGLTVLALYGAGTGNVDVPAHASGFVTGAVMGFFAGLRPPVAAR
jgi:membrane associated rhomboid family serine protease